MNIAILGSGGVGRTLADKLITTGCRVRMGSRTADNPTGQAWAAGHGDAASAGTFADAAAFGEVIFLATPGAVAADVAASLPGEAVADKLLIDLTNPLDFSKGSPPTLFVCNDDSLGERVQRAAPRAKVVKTLNTLSAHLMVDPGQLPGDHLLFLSSDHPDAADACAALLQARFGWRPEQLLRLGALSTARGTEMMLPMWLRLWSALGSDQFNWQLSRG